MANWAALQELLIDKPVFKRAKHGIHFQNADGSITANFSGKPCHYLDGGIYKPIDTKLIAIGTEYGAPGLKPRITKSGLVRIDGTNYSQQSTRIGIFNPNTKSFSAIKKIPLGSLAEDKLIAESGVWRRELRLTEDGLKEEIIIASKPTNTGATLQDWLVLETAVSGMSVPDGWLNDYEVGEFKFPPPSAHDAEGNEADCKRYARNVNGVQYIYTGVSAAWLNSAVYPVVIDPDFSVQPDATAGKDAMIYAGTPGNNYGVHPNIFAGKGAAVFRGLLQFDISSIDSGVTVTAGTVDLYCDGGGNVAERNVLFHRLLVEWTEGTQSGVAGDCCWLRRKDSTNWAASGAQSGTDYTATATATTAVSAYTAWYQWNILADVQAWVAGTATNYGNIIIGDEVNYYKSFKSSDYTTDTSLRPKLAVTYTAGASGNPWNYYAQQM